MVFSKYLDRVHAPPIKCQGIKTKLVNFIRESIKWNENGRWIEPFLGSGVLLFNIAPTEAIAADINPHIVKFYQSIQAGKITSNAVLEYLEVEGSLLKQKGEQYYYEVRDRFNRTGAPLDLLFLNRACFNGVMRFNQRGKFNVPFGHKPDRFRKAHVTKIVNQVKWVIRVMEGKKWVFRCSDWREILRECKEGDFVYVDPPYYGRHTDYYNKWSRNDLVELAHACKALSCGFALSMWNKNVFRKDELLWRLLGDLPIHTFQHFYHVGPTESLRHPMEEALVIKPGFEVKEIAPYIERPKQPVLGEYF